MNAPHVGKGKFPKKGAYPQLSQLDDCLDQAIMCLRQISGGYLHHYDENKVAASKRLVECIDKYGSKLYSLNHNAETIALKNLIRDLQSKPTCVQALKELQLEGVVDEMNQANTEFEALFIQRLEEYSQYEFRSSKELNKLATEAYRLLVQHVEAHAVLTPAEPYTSLINHLNENIEHFNQMVERRKTGFVVQEEADTVTDEQMDSPAV